MQHKKATLGVIIILLSIFLPIAIFSTVVHIERSKPVIDNPNHEFFYNNKLYFYDGDNLLGTYSCQNEYCDYASTSNKALYPLRELVNEKNTKFSLIDGRYAFLNDNAIGDTEAPIILYDLETNREMSRYKTVKNYGVGIDQNEYIVENLEGNYGVLQFYDGVRFRIAFDTGYAFIGLPNILNGSGKVESSNFAVFKDNVWNIIDSNNKKLTEDFTSPIITYNLNYVITKTGDIMNLYTYDGMMALNESGIYMDFWSKYLAVVTTDYNFYLYDLTNNEEVTARMPIDNIDDIRYEIKNGHLYIYVKEVMQHDIEIR